ncbi:hypothetical protein [Streptomyces abikoensis]|uniref:hypothetical protein n=1 Tax=Streptomyces abikoensis TaxID=97398 RepID=UPI001671D960|nr:hypothetical protein [Streptomyces abikoensis]GGP60319.1 hypothetical protein GCM10010214_37350 [Streptomyces abikoensis]
MPHDNIRHAAARTARELSDAFKAHGCTVQVVPQGPVDGQMFLFIDDALTGYEAQLLTAALAAYTAPPPRCEECQAIKRDRAKAVRDGNREMAMKVATAMGVHQRVSHG